MSVLHAQKVLEAHSVSLLAPVDRRAPQKLVVRSFNDSTRSVTRVCFAPVRRRSLSKDSGSHGSRTMSSSPLLIHGLSLLDLRLVCLSSLPASTRSVLWTGSLLILTYCLCAPLARATTQSTFFSSRCETGTKHFFLGD